MASKVSKKNQLESQQAFLFEIPFEKYHIVKMGSFSQVAVKTKKIKLQPRLGGCLEEILQKKIRNPTITFKTQLKKGSLFGRCADLEILGGGNSLAHMSLER